MIPPTVIFERHWTMLVHCGPIWKVHYVWCHKQWYLSNSSLHLCNFSCKLLLCPVQMQTPVIVNNFVSPAPLPRQGDNLAEGRVCRVSGWGFTSPTGGTPTSLHTAIVPIISSAYCNRTDSYDGNITENMICAGYADGGTDACNVSYTFVTLFQNNCHIIDF